MKVKRLIIENIGMVADVNIELSKPLILFYGEIMNGKTTILNAVKYCLGGAYPADIIQHGKTEAKVKLEFEGGSVTREWYIGRDGATKSRDIVFVMNGEVMKSPVSEIRKFLNPFLLDQDYLRKMNETERKAYFVQLLGVDTSDLDVIASKCEAKAKELRAKVKGYGDIDLTKYEPIDVSELQVQLANIKEKHKLDEEAIEAKNQEIRDYNSEIDKSVIRLSNVKETIKSLRDQINALNMKMYEAEQLQARGESWLEKNPRRTEIEKPAMPDTSVIERRISEAGANQVRVERYQENLKRSEEKKVDETNIATLEAKQREIKKQKVERLIAIKENCPIKDLSFDDDGQIIYQGTHMGMLSTSQTMRLSSELSKLYPEGFGLDLIDRAESLGKSVFQFVDKAKAENKTILATIVGERPAKVSEEIGVFVVENGELK